MCLLVRRQYCRQERKIIKAHYMLAYECGLRRLRSGRVAHRLSDYNRHIAYDQCLSGFIYHYYHPPSFLITKNTTHYSILNTKKKGHFVAPFVVLYACIIGLFSLDNKKECSFFEEIVVIICVCAIFVVSL